MGLKDFKSYLKEGMGLLVTDGKWSGAGDLPLFLAKAVSYRLCSCNGVGFIAAEVEREASLPELKRMASQVSARAGMPVAIVAQIDARPSSPRESRSSCRTDRRSSRCSASWRARGGSGPLSRKSWLPAPRPFWSR